MPIYEFKCTSCKEVFEDSVPVGQKTHKCPHCGGKSKKIISSVGIIFKGSGFYCTDNRKQNGNGNNKAKEKTKEPDIKETKVSKKED